MTTVTGLRQKVLIVEDDPEVRHLYTDMLTDTYDVESVESGEAAMGVIDDTFDVVLLDRRLPGISGRETLSRLREAGFTVPVALVTAVEPDFDILEMGFDDYVVKPVATPELLDVVEMLLLRREYDDIMREYFSLVTKVTTLRRNKDAEELVDNEEYIQQNARLEEIEEQAEVALDTAIESGKFEELLKDLDTTRTR